MSIREQKARQIIERARITRDGNLYLVPSQSGRGKYQVDAEKKSCSCPDFEFRRQSCKYLSAVELTIKRETTTTVKTDVKGKTTTTTKTTETIKVTRKTYPQQWPAYNKAHTQEKRLFLYLLKQL